MMLASAAIAALACLPICMVGGNYWMFFVGRALQGVAAGVIGVVVPMDLAECLDANSRGKGAGMFQLLDFIGITFCSIVGLVVVHTIGAADDAAVSAASKSLAWKTIFWSSAVPAVLFFLRLATAPPLEGPRPLPPSRLGACLTGRSWSFSS